MTDLTLTIPCQNNSRAGSPSSLERRLEIPPKALRLLTKALVCCVLVLIFAGALVTSNHAGLAVPDWPTSFGENMFLFPPSRWIGGIFYEHVHRLIASAIGFLTLILTICILCVEKRKWVRHLSVAGLVAVILQGLLGGLTVLFLLPPAISVSHAVLGQTFFAITIVLAYSQSLELTSRVAEKSSGSDSSFRRAMFCLALIYAQLILGAAMRHMQAGLAIPDFPTMGGGYIPTMDAAMLENINRQRASMHLMPVTIGQVYLHLIHRIGAVVVACGVLFCCFRIRAEAVASSIDALKIRRVSVLMGLVVVLQFALGIATVISGRHPHTTSMHVAGGALLLGLTVLAALRTYPLRKAS